MNQQKSDSEFGWLKSFNKSIINNAQLVFSKKITISAVLNGLPYSEIMDIEHMYNVDDSDTNKLPGFICHIDNRSIFHNALINNFIVHVSNFFPLSREKYKMNCLVYVISASDKNIDITKHIKNDKQLDEYLKLNIKYTHHSDNQNISESEEYYKKSNDFINKISSYITNNTDINNKLNNQWKLLNNEAKLNYESVDKDSCKPSDLVEKVIHHTSLDKDLENFTSQEEVNYSKNFSIVYLLPLDVEHTIFPMPQVVANSRKTSFESLMKPHRKPRKFYFMFDFSDANWKFNELNI